MAGRFGVPPLVMTALHIPKSIGAAFPPSLRLWALPALTAILILSDKFWAGMDSVQLTMVAAVAIVVAGIPHGTLDAEIAAAHFGQRNIAGKAKIIAVYIACALSMVLLWALLPEFALISFLVISVVHFSQDWRGGVDPFLAMMVGWALVALPALSHPQAVAMIFEMLTGNQGGATIAALLACTSIPAALGSLVFAYWAFQHGDVKSAAELTSCIVAALFLPPLIAFAIFFCGLHSPRHMADALRETKGISAIKKVLIVVCVFALSISLGVALFLMHENTRFDTRVIRAAFVLISTLTAPHFILEHLLSIKRTTDEQPQRTAKQFIKPRSAKGRVLEQS
jgi:beta-carotene 15,15'-dioxygenase